MRFLAWTSLLCACAAEPVPPPAPPVQEVAPEPTVHEVEDEVAAVDERSDAAGEEPAEKGAKIEVPEFTGAVSESFNFTINGQEKAVKAGSFFEVMLGEPVNVPPAYEYTWMRPRIQGKVRFVERIDSPVNGGSKPIRFIFYAGEEGQGTVVVRRKYATATADPAPDFSARFVIQ